MRPQKVMDEDLLNGLMEVLRSKGYAGASLNDLANSSGLKKASLYHRYPGGKKEITEAVLQHVGDWLNLQVLQVLKDTSISPKQRLNLVLKNINQIYNKGSKTCILGVMCTSNALTLFSKELQDNMNVWIDGFNHLGLDFGCSKKEAKTKAIKVLVLVEGSLLVANTFKDPAIFQNTLKEVKTLYLE